MKDLQLISGDLVAGPHGLATVTGSGYVRQRVATALSEPYGSDPYHPTWGSALAGYLGGPILAGTPGLVSSEASRVLAQLVAAQQLLITTSTLNQVRSQLQAADVIASVDSVTATPGASPSTVVLSVSLTTQGGQQLSVSKTVSP